MNIQPFVRRAQKLADSITQEMSEADVAEVEAKHSELLEHFLRSRGHFFLSTNESTDFRQPKP